jgi:hypothetical protein
MEMEFEGLIPGFLNKETTVFASKHQYLSYDKDLMCTIPFHYLAYCQEIISGIPEEERGMTMEWGWSQCLTMSIITAVTTDSTRC